MRGNKLYLLVLAVLIGSTIVFGIGSIQKNTDTTTNEHGLPEEQVVAGEPVYAISGIIASVNDDNQLLIRRATIASTGSGGPAERTVVITDKTELAALVPLTGKDLTAAMKQYQNEVKKGENTTPPPTYKEVLITPSDLRITMDVQIVSADDVRMATTIKADKITFYAPPSTPPVVGR